MQNVYIYIQNCNVTFLPPNVTFYPLMLPECYLFLPQKVTLSDCAVSWLIVSRHSLAYVKKAPFFIFYY